MSRFEVKKIEIKLNLTVDFEMNRRIIRIPLEGASKEAYQATVL